MARPLNLRDLRPRPNTAVGPLPNTTRAATRAKQTIDRVDFDPNSVAPGVLRNRAQDLVDMLPDLETAAISALSKDTHRSYINHLLNTVDLTDLEALRAADPTSWGPIISSIAVSTNNAASAAAGAAAGGNMGNAGKELRNLRAILASTKRQNP